MRKLAFLVAFAVSSTAHAAITGSVVDLDAKPIAGATIRVYAAEGSDATRARLVAGKLDREPVATAQSAENGSFSIDLKTPAAVDVTIEAPSHNHTTIATVDGDDLGVIVLGSPSTRTVRITSGGKPVANAIVVSGLEVARTKASGEVPASNGTYFVVHPDYAIVARGSGNTTEIKLTPGVAVRGRVVKGADPVAHAMTARSQSPTFPTVGSRSPPLTAAMLVQPIVRKQLPSRFASAPAPRSPAPCATPSVARQSPARGWC
jgi:hypothetical protein